jgi:hypothetical protein
MEELNIEITSSNGADLRRRSASAERFKVAEIFQGSVSLIMGDLVVKG